MKGSTNTKSFTFGQSYIDLQEDMNSFIKRFYSIHHVTLSIIGLWPYQERKTRLIRGIFAQAVLFCIFIAHTMKLVSIGSDLDLFLEIFPYTLILTSLCAAYFCSLAKIREVRMIWNHIQCDWNETMSTQEINILEQYTLTSKLYNSILLVGCQTIPVFQILQMISPIALDIILPLNESRPLIDTIQIEIPTNERKYYCLTVFLIFFIFVYAGILATATYGSFVIHVQHACGMFRLAWYTLNEAFEKTNKKWYTMEENDRIYSNIVRSIKLHKRAIEFTDIVNIYTERLCLIQISILFLMNATNIFRLFRIKALKQEPSTAVMCLLHILTSFVISSANFYISQSIIDHSMAVFDQAYTTPWHMLYPKAQRLLLMLMMSSLKPYYISIGNMFISCYEFYATYLQTTLSYTMILYSLQ